MIGYDGTIAALTYRWDSAPCRIITSRVGEVWQGQERRFRLEVVFEYRVAGATHRSDSFTSKEFFSGIDHSSSDYGEVARQAAASPAGSTGICFVNPADPSVAILERRKLWFYPLALTGGPGFICLYVLFKRRLAQRRVSSGVSLSATHVSVVGKNSSDGSVLLTAGVGLMALGGFLYYSLNMVPEERAKSARAWSEVPCVVVSCQFKEVRQRHGTTCSPDILYAYRVKDREFKSNRYRFTDESSESPNEAMVILRRYPVGHTTTCYVNPADSTDAVLLRDTHTDFFPWFMIAGGVSAAIWGLRVRRSGMRLNLPSDLEGVL